MKEIDEIELNGVAAGRALNAEERYTLSQYNNEFNEKIRAGKLSPDDIEKLYKNQKEYIDSKR